jgi:hypothetical protein
LLALTGQTNSPVKAILGFDRALSSKDEEQPTKTGRSRNAAWDSNRETVGDEGKKGGGEAGKSTAAAKRNYLQNAQVLSRNARA